MFLGHGRSYLAQNNLSLILFEVRAVLYVDSFGAQGGIQGGSSSTRATQLSGSCILDLKKPYMIVYAEPRC